MHSTLGWSVSRFNSSNRASVHTLLPQICTQALMCLCQDVTILHSEQVYIYCSRFVCKVPSRAGIATFDEDFAVACRSF